MLHILLVLVCSAVAFRTGDDHPTRGTASRFPTWDQDNTLQFQSTAAGAAPFTPFGPPPTNLWYSGRPKYASSYVMTLQPLSNYVLITDPANFPDSNTGNTWPVGWSWVVAAGPGAQAAGVNEGDLVYTEHDCPVLNRRYLNQPAGSVTLYSTLFGSPVDAQIGQDPVLYRDATLYCVVNTAAIRGKMFINSFGANRNEPDVSRIQKPRPELEVRSSDNNLNLITNDMP